MTARVAITRRVRAGPGQSSPGNAARPVNPKPMIGSPSGDRAGGLGVGFARSPARVRQQRQWWRPGRERWLEGFGNIDRRRCSGWNRRQLGRRWNGRRLARWVRRKRRRSDLLERGLEWFLRRLFSVSGSQQLRHHRLERQCALCVRLQWLGELSVRAQLRLLRTRAGCHDLRDLRALTA